MHTARSDIPSPLLSPSCVVGWASASTFGKAMQSAATQKVQQVSQGLLTRLFTGGAVGAADVQGDLSAQVRLGISSPAMPDNMAAQLTGLTTAVNSFQGAVALDLAKHRFQVAYAARDSVGMLESVIDMIRSVFQSLFGTVFLGYRITQSCVLIQGSSASTATIKAAALLGVLAVPLTITFFAAIALWGAVKLYKNIKLYAQLSSLDSQEQLWAFLSKRVRLDSKRELFKLRGIKSVNEVKAYRKLIRWEGLELLTDVKMRSNPQADRAQVRAELEASFQSDFRDTSEYQQCLQVLGLESKDVGQLQFSLLELVGFCVQERRRDARKIAKWDRLTESGCTAAVRKAEERGLGRRLASTDPLIRSAAQKECSALVDRVHKANTKQALIHTACIVIGALGVASVLVVGWHMVIITAVLMSVMLCLDLYSAREALHQSGPVGPFAKRYAVFIGALAVASFVASAVTLGGAIVPLIGAAVLALTGVAISTYTYEMLKRKERQWKEKNFTLIQFRNLLAQQPSPEVIEATFKRLQKEERSAIKAAYRAKVPVLRKLEEITDPKLRMMIVAKGAKKSWKYWALAPGSDRKAEMLTRRVLDAAEHALHVGTDEAYAVLGNAQEEAARHRLVKERLDQDISLIIARRLYDDSFRSAVSSCFQRSLPTALG